MRRNHRPDNVRSGLVKTLEGVGAFWLPTGPFDGWAYWRGWHLVEMKDPACEGHKDEFTKDQIVLIARLKERQIPFHILRTDDDALALMGARRTA